MGNCLTKKSTCSSPPPLALTNTKQETKPNNTLAEKKGQIVRKEIFVIKHRISHEGSILCSNDSKGTSKKPNEAAECAKKADFSGELVSVRRVSSCSKKSCDFDSEGLIWSKHKKGVFKKPNEAAESAKNPNFSGLSAPLMSISSCSKKSCDFDSEGTSNEGSFWCKDKKGHFKKPNEATEFAKNPNFSRESCKKSCDFDCEGSMWYKDKRGIFKKEATESAKNANFSGVSAPLKSCTKEEFDVLIQCGRLSSSPSTSKTLSFSGCGESSDNTNYNTNRSRKYSNSTRSCDFDNESRRVSISPSRRSESPVNVRSRKMDNAGGAELISKSGIQRIQVKRNVSPRARSRSPARMNAKLSNENKNFQQLALTLSRSSSRRKENSPFRRYPLSEIDSPVAIEPVPSNPQKLNAENVRNGKVTLQGKLGTISKVTPDYNANGEVKEQLREEAKELNTVTPDGAVNNVAASRLENLEPRGIRRLSRDLDVNPTQSYADLLLEDIQNFHQKSSNPAILLPPCVTRACSILDAVADLNNSSTTSESNSIAGGKQCMVSLSSREPPNSADSWDPSKSYTRLHINPLAF